MKYNLKASAYLARTRRLLLAVMMVMSLTLYFAEPSMVLAEGEEVSFTFNDFDQFVAGKEIQVSITVQVGNIGGINTETTPLRYRSTLTNGSGDPISGQEIFYPDAGDDPGDTSTWSSLVTDGNGQAFFGPGSGFTLNQIPALRESGQATPFLITLGAGDYRLTVELLDWSDSENPTTLGDPGSHMFVVPLVVDGACADGDSNNECDDGYTYKTIQAAIDNASAGDTINVAAGTYAENGQIVIDKDLSIVGDPVEKPVIQPLSDLPATGGDAGAWFLVKPGATLQMSNVVLDGDTKVVWMGIQIMGSTVTIDGVDFRNIQGSASGQPYRGVAIAVYGGAIDGGSGSAGSPHLPAHLALSNSTFEQIGRIGVLVKGTDATANITENTYTGKGEGDFLDYAFEVGAGGSATIVGNTITNNLGVASSDGSTSAGILATTFYGSGTAATITGNDFLNNTAGIVVGYDDNDTSMVTAHFNTLSGNVDNGIESIGPTVNATNNWWGHDSGPGGEGPGTGDSVSINVDFDPWLGSDPVVTQIDGSSGLVSGPMDNFSITYDGSSSAQVILSVLSSTPGADGTLFGSGNAFFDIFVDFDGTPDGTLNVTLPNLGGTGDLQWFDGSSWEPVVGAGGTSPIVPVDGFYNFTLDTSTSSPTLEELTGTPFSGASPEVWMELAPGFTDRFAEGETVNVVVKAGSSALYGVDLSFSYDAGLEVTKVVLGGNSAGTNLYADTVSRNQFGGGTISFAFSQRSDVHPDNVDDDEIELATITFLATGTGASAVQFDGGVNPLLVSDKNGNNGVAVSPLIVGTNPLAFTIDPSPDVFVNVALQGRSDFAGVSLRLSPADGSGNVLYDTDDSDGMLAADPVPAKTYDVRVDAPKYLAAVREVEVVPGNDSIDLNTGAALVLHGGDVNDDDRINIQDLVLIGVNFGGSEESVDINGDGTVNIQDLAIAAGNFGSTSDPGGSAYADPW